MKLITEHALTPSWMGTTGEPPPLWKGCKQGAHESPQLWNVLLD